MFTFDRPRGGAMLLIMAGNKYSLRKITPCLLCVFVCLCGEEGYAQELRKAFFDERVLFFIIIFADEHASLNMLSNLRSCSGARRFAEYFR